MHLKFLTFVFVIACCLMSSRVAAIQVSNTDFIVDCSGCSPTAKRNTALVQPGDWLLDGSHRSFNVDVTDFENRIIVRYQVNLILVRRNGNIVRGASLVPVPASKQLEFSKALEVVGTITFLGPDDDFAGVEPIPTTYPSAFNLVGDNGSQQLLFSNTLNNTEWPDTSSSIFAGSTIGDALEAVTQMLLDYLGQNIQVITEAFDGTIIIVKGQLIQGQDGTIRVLWEVVEGGLRLSDGNVITESIGGPGTNIPGTGGGSAVQLYNGLTGRGLQIDFKTLGGSGQCQWEFKCDSRGACTLTLRGDC